MINCVNNETFGSDGYSGKTSFAFSESFSDENWDNFLQTTTMGHFQQSSMWSRFKKLDRWKVLRCVLRRNNAIIGGFQILWREYVIGRIGYVSKGPAVLMESEELSAAIVEKIIQVAADIKLDALIVQPPDESKHLNEALKIRQFELNWIKTVIHSTLIHDLSNGLKDIVGQMNRSTRREIKLAKRNGVVIREGDQKDLGKFFKLMRSTCSRQKVKPNPSNETQLRRLWEVFNPIGARLTFASRRNIELAGLFNIPFGNRVTSWKKGWNYECKDAYPMKLLNYEGLEWACSSGYQVYDYAGLNCEIAMNLVANIPLTHQQIKSRDMFNLGFGGKPILLPLSYIWFRNNIVRQTYGKLSGLRFILRN